MSELQERIEQYILGQMSDEEKSAFESEIENNVEIQQEIEKYRLLNEVLEESIALDLKEHFDSKEISSGESKGRVIRFNIYRYAAAAVIIALMGFGLWYFAGDDSLSPKQYAASVYTGYDVQILRNESAVIPYEQAIEMQDAGNTIGAIENILVFLKENNDPEARYFLAHLYAELEMYTEAKGQLLQISESGSIRFQEKAEWDFIVISMLSNYDGDADNLLDRILSNPNHSYYEQARFVNEEFRN